jgi:hypothetical protein
VKRLKLLIVAACLAAAAALAFVVPAEADDCASKVHGIQDVGNPQNVQDCLRTGQAYSVTIGAVVAGVGVAIAVAGLPGGRSPAPPRVTQPQPPAARREPEQPSQSQQHADPCFDQQTRFTTAQTMAKTHFSALQTLRTQRAYLESIWESTRETGYLSSVVDLAMLAGSVFAKPAAALAGVTLAKQTLWTKVGEAMLKSLGKEMAKDVVKFGEDQGIDWSDLAAKPIGITQTPQGPAMPVPQGGTGKLYTELIKKALTQLELDRITREMTGSGKLPDVSVIESTYSGPISDALGNTFSILTMGTSVFKVSDKLAAIRKAISKLDDHVSQCEDLWESAVNELDLAGDSLNRCRALHLPAGPAS